MSSLEPGARVTPNVRLVRRLGAGGMGSVWVADHLALRTQVVVKFMAAELAANAEAMDRFSREAAAAAQVKSPHVVQMLDHGVTADGVPFIVMELLEGTDLGKRLVERGRLVLAEAAEILGQVCKALARAHESGIVHRDIKPDNIFLCASPDGDTFVKLLDFGIAKGDGRLGGSSGTRTGAMIGTPYYMSPEQLVGSRSIDWRTDLWSLGVVAYECVVGTKPFNDETFGALAVRIHSGPIPVPSDVDPSLPASFDRWFATACAREPSARFATAKELADALRLVASAGGQGPDAHAHRPATAHSAVALVPADGGVGAGTHGGLGLPTLAPHPRASAAWAVPLSLAFIFLAIAAVVIARHANPSGSAAAHAPPAVEAPAIRSPPVPEPAAEKVAVPEPIASSGHGPAPPASTASPEPAPAASERHRDRAAAPATRGRTPSSPGRSAPATSAAPSSPKIHEADIF